MIGDRYLQQSIFSYAKGCHQVEFSFSQHGIRVTYTPNTEQPDIILTKVFKRRDDHGHLVNPNKTTCRALFRAAIAAWKADRCLDCSHQQ